MTMPLDKYDRDVEAAEARLAALRKAYDTAADIASLAHQALEAAEAALFDARLERDEYVRAREQGG